MSIHVARKKMNHEKSIRLIELYKNHLFLWDPKEKDYHDRAKREDAWKEMSAILQQPVSILKSKMKSLMGSYRSERSRENKRRITGSGSEDAYESKWFAYKYLDFLKDKDNTNATLDAARSENPREDDQHYQEEYVILESLLKEEDLGCFEDDVDGNSEDTNSNAENVPTTSHQPADWSSSIRVRRPAAMKRPANSTVRLDKTEPVVSKLQRLPNFYKEDDEFDLFGKSIAVQLRNMPLERALVCQETLQAVMKEERLYQYHHLS